MSHPPGFHKNEETRSRCYGCNGSGLLDVTPADEERAKKLIAEGWMQISGKYRTVVRMHVPKAEHAITFSSDVPSWLREEVLSRYSAWIRHHAHLNHPEAERLELSPSEFRAFKKLGGMIA